MELFGVLRRLFGQKADTETTAPVAIVQQPEPVDIYPPGFRELASRTICVDQDVTAPIPTNHILVAMSDLAGSKTFVNQALDLPEIQEYIKKNGGSEFADPLSILQSALSRAVEREDRDTVKRLLDLGVNPQSNTPDPVSDALFVSMVGYVPTSFKRDGGPWTSKKTETSDKAKEIFTMLFENCRDRWKDDRAGFINSLSGGKAIRGDTVSVWGSERMNASSSHAGTMDAARPDILEVLKEIDPQIYRFKDHLHILQHRLNSRTSAPNAPAA